MAFNLVFTRTVTLVNVKPNLTFNGANLGSYQSKPSLNFSPILLQTNRTFSNDAYSDREKAFEDLAIKQHEKDLRKKLKKDMKEKEKQKEAAEGKDKEKSKEGKEKEKIKRRKR